MDIMRFKGGLGNQMFQYALMEALRECGRQVRGNLGFYKLHINEMPFILDKVFPNVILEEVSDKIFNIVNERWQMIKADPQQMYSYWDDIMKVFFFV